MKIQKIKIIIKKIQLIIINLIIKTTIKITIIIITTYSNNNENSNNNNNNNNNQNINKEENNLNNNEFSSEIPKEIQMSSSTEDDTTISKFIFHECDNKYFTNELRFFSENSKGLSSTYCLNKSELTSSNLNFTLFRLIPLGKCSNPLVFAFEQNCLSQTCTNEENNKYKKVIKQKKKS
jgi:hypothetical protein